MRRFFRSAAFPILIVIVLAFFAQRLISPGSSEQTPTYSDFIAQIKKHPKSIDSVTVQPKTNDIQVSETSGSSYTTGYPNNTEKQFTSILERNDISTKVEGTGGSSLFSILTYILPFI